MMMTMDGFKYLFESKIAAVSWLRNVGMDMFDSMKPHQAWRDETGDGIGRGLTCHRPQKLLIGFYSIFGIRFIFIRVQSSPCFGRI